MEADDLDTLIADSLGGIQSALDADRRVATGPGGSSHTDATAARNIGEAVRELRQGPRSEGVDGEFPNEELFTNLVNTLQDECFQTAMTDALRGVDADSANGKSSAGGGGGELAETSAAGGIASNDSGVEDFLQAFLKSFDAAAASDGNFGKEINTLMSSMLSNDLICKPLEQIAELLDPWLRSQKSLPAADRTRYEEQLALYKKLVGVYKQSPDPLPEAVREQVQRLLADLHDIGQPPDEVMQQIVPKDAEEGGESFDDFMRSMGLDQGFGTAEQDLLKKLTEDPEELTKAMKEMAEGLPEEGCKQQ